MRREETIEIRLSIKELWDLELLFRHESKGLPRLHQSEWENRKPRFLNDVTYSGDGEMLFRGERTGYVLFGKTINEFPPGL